MHLITSRNGTTKMREKKLMLLFCILDMVSVEDDFGCVGGEAFLFLGGRTVK
jgi:hypothetical protein